MKDIEVGGSTVRLCIWYDVLLKRCSKYYIGTVFLRLPVDTSDVVSDTTRPVNY